MRTVHLDQITCCPDGTLELRFVKRVWDTGEVVLQQPHRTSVDTLSDVEIQMQAVNEHLEGMGYPAVGSTVIQLISDIKALYLTDVEVRRRQDIVRSMREAHAANEAVSSADNG